MKNLLTFKTKLLLLTLLFLALSFLITSRAFYAESQNSERENANLKVAKFTASGELVLPDDLDRWVFLGTSVGEGYSEARFDPAKPGMLQVVQMEPKAYEYFTNKKRYADGSMFLLSFYKTQEKPSPELNGFVQGELSNFEIHLIDRKQYDDDRVFFMFGKDDKKSAMLPAGNECVQCHNKHGIFDGTFAQFYPTIRKLIPKDSLKKAGGNE